MYVIDVTDSTLPKPIALKWKPFWNTADFPERIPPPLQGAARPDLVAASLLPPQPQQPQPQQVSHHMQFPTGLPSGGIMFQPPPPPQQPQPQNGYGYGYQGYTPADAERRRLEDRLTAAEAEAARARSEALQMQHAANLEREKAANAAAVQRLEQKLAEMAALITNGPANNRNPELEAIKESNRLMELRLAEEKREREAERRERDLKEAIAASAAKADQQIQAMREMMLQQQQASQQNSPMIQLMIEQSRNSTEAMKEIARESSKAVEKMQLFMMSPKDVIQMQKDSSSGVDSIGDKVARVYTGVVEMQQKVLENALQMNQGGSEIPGLIREGITSAKEAFERYVVTKSKEGQVTQQAQAQIATVTAQRDAIQAQAQTEIARIHNMPVPIQEQPAPRPRPIPVQQSSGLGSPPAGSAAFDAWQKARQTNGVAEQPAQPTQLAGRAGANGDGRWSDSTSHQPEQQPQQVQQPQQPQQASPNGQPLRHGRTDEDWFGPFLGEVTQLRQGVAFFIFGLQQNPKIVQGATPVLVADGIMQAMGVVVTQGIPVPAMVELLNNSLFDEFLEVLLPDAPETFREDVAEILAQRIDGDDPEEEDDDGEPKDDVKDGSAVKPKVRSTRVSAARA